MANDDEPDVVKKMRQMIRELNDALREFGEHDRRVGCLLADWRGGKPTNDGGYESNFGGTWYAKGEHPPCICGLDAALAAREEKEECPGCIDCGPPIAVEAEYRCGKPAETEAHGENHVPFCIGCGVNARDLDEYKRLAAEEGMTAEEYCAQEEGTYNPKNGHFLCTPCYAKAGMPSSPTGWRAP